MQHRRAIFTGALAAACALPLAALPQTRGGVGRSGRVGGKPVRTVDVHAHCVVDTSAVLDGTPFQARGRVSGALVVDDARLEGMAKQAIDVEVLSVNPWWYAMERDLADRFIDRQNAKLAEITQAYPGRFYALASIAMQHPDLAAAQLEDAVRRRGMRGAALGCTIMGEELASRRFDPFWAKAQDLQAMIFLHPQDSANATGVTKRVAGGGPLSNVIGNPLETTIALSHLIFQGTLDRYPQLRICAAHGGGYLTSYPDRGDYGCRVINCTDPPPKKQPSAYMRDLYVDSIIFTPEGMRHLAAVCGPDKIMIGTDHPNPWVDDPVGLVMATPGLSNADRTAILGGTACALLDIPV